jgi:alkylation response protein AidB-like acyl-CoA dehydrogenase
VSFDLNRSADQRQILDAAAAMLAASYPPARLREKRADDLSALAEFGTFALALPEDHGGAGLSLVEEALVHVLLGRHVVSSRAVATAISGRLAAALGRDDLAREAAAGTLAVAAAVPSGDSVLAIDAGGARFAVLFDDRRLALLDLQAASGEEVSGLGHGVPITRLGHNAVATVGDSTESALLDSADLLVSAQLLGVAAASRDLAVSYVQIRKQFGRPIGSFQAIKHHCANMAIAAEAVSSLLDMAAISLRDGRDDASFQIAALRRLAPQAALDNARMCIQLHGGIGFSAEADAHHFLKQAHLLSRLGGGAAMLDLSAPLAPHSSIKERL